MVLDPIFIFVFDLGVSGASLATAVSQCFGWCVLLWGTSRPGNVHIKPKNFTPTLYYYKEITRGGLPSLARQALSVVATISLNRMAVHYALPSNEASTVAAFTIVSRITLFCFAIVSLLPLSMPIRASAVILSATPCASIILNLAEMHRSETDLSANCVLVSTLLCFLTIPALTLLLTAA